MKRNNNKQLTKKQMIIPKTYSPPSNGPSMIDSIKSGFGFGVGSSIAHNTINNIFSSDTKNVRGDCNDSILLEYNKCIKDDICSQDVMNILKNALEKCKL
jgi:hypothetical protein